ncbi:MAG: BatD family protein [Pseudomonadota bacterium]|nr:BatD family protein [Pseudomonadota bacterium]
MKPLNKLLYFFIGAITVLLFSGYLSLNCMAAVSARLDRQTIRLDETVNLSVEADGAMNSIAGLDASALEKDFSIVNQSTSSNFQIINGSSKATKTWNIELEPKHAGRLTIPSFTIRGEKTAPITLTVTTKTPTTPGSSSTIDDVLSIEVLPVMETPAYLQGQITISVKLYLKSQLNLSEASLEEPKLEHATVIKLGDDRRYQSRRNGVVYQVIERKYAIFPEEGHEVTVPSLLFQAITNAGGNRFFSRDPFFNRFPGQRRRLRARSQELKIPLAPIPREFEGKVWLPARKITIKEDKIQLKELKVGEPLTRTIQIEALGLTAAQLPEIKVKAPDGCKIYLDQPELKNQIDGDYLHGIKRQSMAFIPSQAGMFTLPNIAINWWDVRNNRQQKAVLSAHKVKVVAVPGQPHSSAGKQDNNPSMVQTGSQNTAKNQASLVEKKSIPEKSMIFDRVQFWQVISLILLLVWFFTIFFWRQSRRQQVVAQQKRKMQTEKKSMANREQIKKACLDDNPRLAQQAILDWAAANWPQNPPTNLRKLAETVGNVELSEAFAKLEETLYSPAAIREWNGGQFWQTIAKNLQGKSSTKSAGKKSDVLPPLYS